MTRARWRLIGSLPEPEDVAIRVSHFKFLHALKRHSQVAYLKFLPFRFCMQVHDIFRVDAGDIGHTLVGQEDQPSQIVLDMPKLAQVVKQVVEDRGVGGDHRCRRNNR